MSGNKGNENNSSRRSSELPSTTSSVSVSILKHSSTTEKDENFHVDQQDDDVGGDNRTAYSSFSSTKPLIWKPPEYPVQEQTIRHCQDINPGSDPEICAIPTDAEMASLTAKECPTQIRPRSTERHASYSCPTTTTNNWKKRKPRNASILYYTSVEPNFPDPPSAQDYNHSRKQIYQSRRFPQWAWRLLSRSLGIKVSPGDTPLFGTILHMATLMFAFMFSVTGAWYLVFDVRSNYTRTTILIGSISVVLGFSWVAIGVYANKLAARLISNKTFGENVRMHSRTIFKVSAAGLLFFLCLVLVSVNMYHTYRQFKAHPCKEVGIDDSICLVNMVGKTGFGFLALVWNCLVGFVLLSVCRTHTIGIRRFIRELEADGHSYELYWKSQASLPGTKHVDIDHIQAGMGSESGEPYVWYDGYQSDDDSSYCVGHNPTTVPKLSIPCEEEDPIITDYHVLNFNKDGNENPNYANIDQTMGTSVRKRLSTSVSSKVCDPVFMSNNDILLSYWKISWRMRVTSLNLQRWLASWIVFIMVWCGNYIIFWMSSKATLPGIAEFILPLLLLLLISSAFAEANAEGQRMIRCICPTEERIFLLLFLNQQPLQMTVFNFALTYNAIVGVVLAFSVAFASKVIMDVVK